MLTEELPEELTEELTATVRKTLEPRNVKERLQLLATHGWTVSQIFERLPHALQSRLIAPKAPFIVARRKALDHVVLALFVHVDSGRVRRKRVRLKNAARAGIDAMVDVYRLS
jgi:hypothetical protein